MNFSRKPFCIEQGVVSYLRTPSVSDGHGFFASLSFLVAHARGSQIEAPLRFKRKILTPMKTNLLQVLGLIATSALYTTTAFAHDTWVETNTHLARVGEAVHVSLMLGNHGNNHRDFKLAGKVNLDGSTLSYRDPNGKVHDLKPNLRDNGHEDGEGFWVTKFAPAQPGTYIVGHTSAAVMTYAPVRSIKSAKTVFQASRQLDQMPKTHVLNRVLGHPFELVAQSPVFPADVLKVQLLWKGKPLAGKIVSFIPRGGQLTEDFDPRYERVTDKEGSVSFKPDEANYYLIVAHHNAPEEKGEGYESTKYSATLTWYVPRIAEK